MTSFIELARARWSVRSFSSAPIEEEKLHYILQAGLIAPTVLLVCYDERLRWKSPFVAGYDSGEMDASRSLSETVEYV